MSLHVHARKGQIRNSKHISKRDITQGNLEREVPVRSKDELGELTKSFSQMNTQLKPKPRPESSNYL